MSKISRFAVSIAVGLAAIAAVVALSTRPTEARPPGPRCECADIEATVICNDGKLYSNPCVAKCFQAKGCVPYGG